MYHEQMTHVHIFSFAESDSDLVCLINLCSDLFEVSVDISLQISGVLLPKT